MARKKKTQEEKEPKKTKEEPKKTEDQKKPKFSLPPRLTQEELKAFVMGYVNGTVYTNYDVDQHILGIVFMPLSLGALAGATKKDLEQIGCIWADTAKDHTTGRSINGQPTFTSCRMMLKEDWAIAREAILKETQRREEVTI